MSDTKPTNTRTAFCIETSQALMTLPTTCAVFLIGHITFTGFKEQTFADHACTDIFVTCQGDGHNVDRAHEQKTVQYNTMHSETDTDKG